jgi:hypothetical protein
MAWTRSGALIGSRAGDCNDREVWCVTATASYATDVLIGGCWRAR